MKKIKNYAIKNTSKQFYDDLKFRIESNFEEILNGEKLIRRLK